MSIPLDRLYHYLESLSSNDIIIYRWHPHGSKKLTDLGPFAHPDYHKDIPKKIKFFTTPFLVCHDQEPLFYNFYSQEECLNQITQSIKAHPILHPLSTDQEFLDTLSHGHLRVMLPFFNIHNHILLCHSERNSSQLKLYEKNNFIGVYYWSHALIARDWFRFAQHDPNLVHNFENITHDFLIYNRAWSGTREYRLKFVEEIVNNQLLKKCNINFSSYDEQQHYRDHCFKNPDLQISRFDFETFIKENKALSSASADYEFSDYNSSAIEVVLETLFDDDRNHLTEKTLRPIACGRPFILVGTPGSLRYLQSYGFKTFNGLINEQYDSIEDPLERLVFVVNEMKRLSTLTHDEKYVLWKELYEIAEYNKKHFFSTQFHDTVVKEFVDNLNSGLKQCQQHLGKWWNFYKKVKKTINDDFSNSVDGILEEKLRHLL